MAFDSMMSLELKSVVASAFLCVRYGAFVFVVGYLIAKLDKTFSLPFIENAKLTSGGTIEKEEYDTIVVKQFLPIP